MTDIIIASVPLVGMGGWLALARLINHRGAR